MFLISNLTQLPHRGVGVTIAWEVLKLNGIYTIF